MTMSIEQKTERRFRTVTLQQSVAVAVAIVTNLKNVELFVLSIRPPTFTGLSIFRQPTSQLVKHSESRKSRKSSMGLILHEKHIVCLA